MTRGDTTPMPHVFKALKRNRSTAARNLDMRASTYFSDWTTPCQTWTMAISLYILPIGAWANSTSTTLTEPPGGEQDPMVLADAESEAGDHVEAAAHYAEAYRALSEDQRRGDYGTFVIKNALREYRDALESPPEGLEQVRAHLGLLRAEAELLAQFITERAAEGVPEAIQQTHVELGLRIRLLERQEAALLEGDPAPVADEPIPPPLEPVPLPAPASLASAKEPSTSGSPFSTLEPSPEPDLANRRPGKPRYPDPRRTAAILGVGGVTLVGGAVTLGVGTWMFNDFIRKGNDMAHDLDGGIVNGDTWENRKEELDDFRQEHRARATGVVVGGAALAATGIGLLSWGLARMQMRKRVIQQDARARNSSKPVVQDGTGLIIASSVAGGLAWANATITRMMAMRFCMDDLEDAGLNDYTSCSRLGDPAVAALTGTNWLINGLTYGLAPAAAEMRGHHDKLVDRWSGKRQRNIDAFLGIGVTLIGIGVAGRITGVVLNTLGDCEPDPKVCRRDVTLEILGAQLSSSTIATGAALLQYGLTYGRVSKRSRRRQQKIGSLRVAPQLGRGFGGLGLTGWF